MEVQCTRRRNAEDIRRQNATVREHEEHVGPALGEPPRECTVAHLHRLRYLESTLDSRELHGGGLELHPSASWPIWLCHDAHDLRHLREGDERGHGDGWGSKEDGAHGGTERIGQ